MVENFSKYKKIYALGHDENKDIFTDPNDMIVIQEKIDGGNFRFMIHNGNIIFGSRTQQLTGDDGTDTNIAKGFTRCVNYVRERLSDKDLSVLEGYIFYGECCIKHTINYDWDKIPPFLGFDIYSLTLDKFYNYEQTKMLYEALTLPMVPLIKIVLAGEITTITDDMVPKSVYALESNKDTQAEGIVFKNYSKQIMGKYVRNAFKERNAEAFGGNPKYNKAGMFDDADIVFKYCTNPRIDKTIFKLVDEGHSLDMTMTGTLIKRVIKDIYEEEWSDILNSNYKIDLKNVRTLIAKRCCVVLQQVMTNNSLNSKVE